MRLKWIFSICTILLLDSCASFKKELVQSGSRKEAIQNAILDFSSRGGLYKKDSVFSVSFHDTLFRMVLNKDYKWINGESNDEIVVVRIGSASDYQFLLTARTTVGSKGKLPSRFVIKGGKLFYWWDDDYPLTDEALAVLKRYNLLQDDEGGLITVPDNPTDDSKEGAHYYFCRKDLSKYKKVITNKGMGYYEPPKLKCNSK